MEATIFNIQRFSLHDGDGIRTLVFFKGCPLRCAWCSNPESQSPLPQLMYNKTLCINCGGCSGACPVKAVAAGENGPELLRDRCNGLGLCAVACPTGALRLAGHFLALATVAGRIPQRDPAALVGAAVDADIVLGLRAGREGRYERQGEGGNREQAHAAIMRRLAGRGKSGPGPRTVGSGGAVQAASSAEPRVASARRSIRAMLAAASRPSCTAVTTRSAPRTASPPANTFGCVVW